MSNTPVKQTIGNFLNFPNTKSFLEKTLEGKKAEFVSNLLALSDNDKNIAECDPKELMMCAMNATAVNLPLNKNLGLAYVIAYKGKPSFQIGTKGWKQLAMRSGLYKIINDCEIRYGELILNKFTGEFKFNKENPDGKIIGRFAFFELMNGYSKCLYMSNADLEAHAIKYVPLYKADLKNKTRKSKWANEDRPFMEKKTVIKLLLSREGLLSTEMTTAISADGEDNSSNHNRNVEEAEIITQEEKPTGAKKVNIDDLQ